MFNTQSQLSVMAVRNPRAIKVFRKYGLDFCCGGARPLSEACAEKNIDAEQVLNEVLSLTPAKGATPESWENRSPAAIIDHILNDFHEKHRADLETLLPLARKVEASHADNPMRPAGIYSLLQNVGKEMEDHMAKEENILFPWILRDSGTPPYAPVKVMMAEHLSHAERLEQLRTTCHNFQLPEEACPSWRALYAGIEQLIADLMEHIHTENNILFPMALNES